MHVDDLVSACLFLLDAGDAADGVFNVGSSREISIVRLASMLAHTVGYKGSVSFDPSKPDGTPRKVMDSSRILAMGWTPQIPLEKGLVQICRLYEEKMHKLAENTNPPQ